jgi:hypothetical protein
MHAVMFAYCKPEFKSKGPTAKGIANFEFQIANFGLCKRQSARFALCHLLGVPITLLWMVGLTNAYNFMDGIPSPLNLWPLMHFLRLLRGGLPRKVRRMRQARGKGELRIAVRNFRMSIFEGPPRSYPQMSQISQIFLSRETRDPIRNSKSEIRNSKFPFPSGCEDAAEELS